MHNSSSFLRSALLVGASLSFLHCHKCALAQGEATSFQRVLLSPLELDSSISKGAYAMDGLSVGAAPTGIVPKFGQSALEFKGVAAGSGSKGDFTVFGPVSGKPQSIGLWVYLGSNANVDTLGLQFVDDEGEYLLARVPAKWTGWKWVEVNFAKSELVQAYEQKDKNGQVDFPLQSVHVFWFAKAAGPSSVIVDALSATMALGQVPNPSLQAQISGAGYGMPNQPLAAQVALTNYGAQSVTPKIDFSLQRDSALFAGAAPDPIYGSDQALGAKSWTVVGGKTVENGSLTDGQDWTGFRTSVGATEAFQYVDLGKALRLTHLVYATNDANWTWKVDISASADGTTYAPVPELQGVNVHGQWGTQSFPEFKPFSARFLRLRYHNDGGKMSDVAFFNGLSAYDGVRDETLSFPQVGQTVWTGSTTAQIGAHDFGQVPLKSDKPLSAGNYLLAVRVQNGAQRQLLYQHFAVMPAPLATVSANSRFGLNTNDYTAAPWQKQLGIGWVRFENMKWPMISSKPNSYTFTGLEGWGLNHDQIVSAFRAQGINFLPYLFQSPDYATSAPADVTKNRESYPPKDNAQMGDFVFQTVARYGSKKHTASELKTADKVSGLNEINTVEIWNEPNLNDPGWGPWVGTSTQYNAMFRVAAEATKRADPSVRVTNGGLAGIGVDTLQTLLAPYPDNKKPLDFVDVLNVHFYSGRTAPELSTNDPNADRSSTGIGVRTYEEDLRRLAKWRDQNKPGLPIWMSETGYDSAGPFGTDERHQAAQLPRDIMLALAAGIEKVIVFRDQGSTPTMFGASGVVRDDGSFKPSWFTYATLIRQLDGVQTGALRLPYPDPNVRLFAWKRGAETLVTAWTIENPATLKLNLGKCSVTDAFGAASQVTIANDYSLSMFPVYIKDIGNTAALQSLVAAGQRAEAQRKADDAKKAKLRAYLFDFGSRDKVGTIDLGTVRSFTSVIHTDVYAQPTGYGFVPGPADHDDGRKWIDDLLDTDSTRTAPPVSFRVDALPGKYQLRLHIGPQGPAHLFIKGMVGGDKTLDIKPDGPVVSLDVEVGKDPLLISNDGYGDLYWLTLIEK